MFSRLGKALTGVAMVASAVGLFAAPAQAAPTVDESAASPMFWSSGCESGRACIRLAHPSPGHYWWNADGCGYNGVHDYYDYAIANGNGFYVYYENDKWDYVAPYSQRTLDGQNLVTSLQVNC